MLLYQLKEETSGKICCGLKHINTEEQLSASGLRRPWKGAYLAHCRFQQRHSGTLVFVFRFV